MARPSRSAGPGTSSTVSAAPASQAPQDALRDGVVPAVAALPFDARVRLVEKAATPEGTWVLSRLPVSAGDSSSGSLGTGSSFGKTLVSASEYGEVLLLDQSRIRILRAFPLPGLPPQRLLVTTSAMSVALDDLEPGAGGNASGGCPTRRGKRAVSESGSASARLRPVVAPPQKFSKSTIIVVPSVAMLALNQGPNSRLQLYGGLQVVRTAVGVGVDVADDDGARGTAELPAIASRASRSLVSICSPSMMSA